MKKLILILLFLSLTSIGFSQASKDLAVALTASVSDTQITLNWPATNAYSIKVFRKVSVNDNSFSDPIANLSGTSLNYTDTAIEAGVAYEYRVEMEHEGYTSNGYLLSGVKVNLKEDRGKLILVVAEDMAIPLEEELNTLTNDIEGDGWGVIRIDVNSTENVVEVRNKIISKYNTDPNEVKAVFIIGHVAVPYSGLIVPDGHIEHQGAWPADGYYGEMDGNWTDESVYDTQADDSRNHNVPGDGKFDQDVLPSDLELQVGRVDFYDLPLFDDSETELLRKYLNKNHAFRHREFIAGERALIDDNFGGGEDSYSSSAYRSFYSMYSPDNIQDKDYFTTLNNESYLWSYGSGAGYYNSVRDVGETADFVAKDVKSVFTMLFGSYMADWDSENNIMRASLASGSVLTCAWSGLPQWQFHHMALGENIGLSAINTGNGFDYEFTDYNSKYVHVSLLGDPTLRMHTVAPPSSLSIINNDKVELSWGASNESVLGYHVYKRMSTSESYQRLTTELILGNTFATDDKAEGRHIYMVRAVKLEETPSGSYYNLSQGVFAEIQLDGEGTSIQIINEDPVEDEDLDEGKVILHPNPATDTVYIESDENVEDILVTDVTGKAFLKPSTTTIDVSTLANGIYIFQFLVNNRLEKRMIIKKD